MSPRTFEEKIKTLAELEDICRTLRAEGKRIVQCHGVFDLMHPGHVRHFEAARAQGDVLVVTVTPDRFVNKGPGRPVFNERLRSESVAALGHPAGPPELEEDGPGRLVLDEDHLCNDRPCSRSLRAVRGVVLL